MMKLARLRTIQFLNSAKYLLRDSDIFDFVVSYGTSPYFSD
jgi:hypothetical protein